MITGGYKIRLIQHIKVCSWSVGIPFQWDKKTQRLVMLKSKIKWALFYFGMFMNSFFQAWITIQTFLNRNLMDFPILVTQGAWLFGFWYAYVARVCGTVKMQPFMELVNSLIEFEEQHLGKQDDKKNYGKGSKGAHIFLIIITVTGITYAMGIVCLIVTQPCAFPHIGSAVFNCFNADRPPSPLWAKALIVILNGWISFNISAGGCFYATQVYIITVSCLKVYVQLVNRMPTKTDADKSKVTKLYREIQVLNIQMDICYRKALLPLVQATWSGMTCTFLYSTIKLYDQIEMPAYLTNPLIAVDGMLYYLVGFGAAGDTYEASLSLIESWKRRNIVARKTAKFGRFVKSCRPVRVQYGNGNFIDSTTSLLFIDFCFSQTISLLIMS